MTGIDLFQLKERHVVVVGGGLGMGRASALLFAAVGAHVAVLDLDPARAASVANEITAGGGVAVPVVADILDIESGTAAIEEAASRLGGLHVLVNIVGMAKWSSFIETTPETFDLEVARNLRYVFFAAQTFARLANDDTPRAIVSVASISGFNSAPNHAAYGAAKAGLMSLTRTMALELGPKGIRVNCVAPGAIRTDRSQRSAEDMTKHPVPLGRIGDQTEIAKAVLFLASDLSSYITGQSLVVDGGSLTNYPFPINR